MDFDDKHTHVAQRMFPLVYVIESITAALLLLVLMAEK